MKTSESKNEIVVYQPDDVMRLEVRLENKSVWLTQAQMCELFQRDVSVISRHIRNVFSEGEVDKESNLHFLQIPNSDRPIAVYSVNVIISVGYRVKSLRGTQFRIWATEILQNYLLRGYRNDVRWVQQERGELDYDAKNMMHLTRLLFSGENIVKNGEPIVRFGARNSRRCFRSVEESGRSMHSWSRPSRFAPRSNRRRAACVRCRTAKRSTD